MANRKLPIQVPHVAVSFNRSESRVPYSFTNMVTYAVHITRSDGQPLATREASWALRQSVFIAVRLDAHEVLQTLQDQTAQLAERRIRAAKQDEKFQAIVARMSIPAL